MSQPVYAYENTYDEQEVEELVDLGTYETTAYVEVFEKVYISEELKAAFDRDGIAYSTESYEVWLIWPVWKETRYRYFYYARTYVEEVVESRRLQNDIDTLIFMVSKLEEYAIEYNSNLDSNDLVLGYLRAVHKSYYSNYDSGIQWKFAAGDVNTGFVNYVKNNDNASIKIREYLANFVSASNYNSDVLGNIINNSNVTHGILLIDPLNPNITHNKIDVIHMFATMDGTYSNTGNPSITMTNNFQRDVSGWAGDLQTFVRYDLSGNSLPSNSLKAFVDNPSSNTVIDFGNHVGLSSSSFGNEDMLADIDAMNITKNYLDLGNSLSNSLSAYYNYASGDNGTKTNRYKLFIDSLAMETESTATSALDCFKHEVYLSLALTKSGSSYSDVWNSAASTYYILLRGSITGGSIHSQHYRIYAANLFIDYIIAMSTPPTTSGGGGGGGCGGPFDPNPGSPIFVICPNSTPIDPVVENLE